MGRFYRFARWLLRGVMPLIWNIKIDNVDGLSREGAYIISCNHIYWFDPLIVAYKSNRMVHFLGKKELFEKRFLKGVFSALGAISIERGEADIGAVKNVLKTLKGGEVMGIFPEGRRTAGEYYDEMHNGAAFFAIRTGCPIIPCGIAGRAKFRGRIQLIVGEPIAFEEYADRKASTDEIDEATRKLGEEIIRLSEKAKMMI